ncbi:MerR family transcriptional regulator [Promicromonospora thailandica]|uniref:DNA-binding transcriptional regulator, MerR family n=1 Tax=Promicromonospora thailandica TaxID=765201 RepID=A0A9X2JT60_9MICO|nr:MerR family transcriptional regulator [Promicromonospora thailandica]MCP2263175.1 DNA-binding transcriptional regulator, MerR family [Promicromonospora thailandica]BFF18561.1 TipAS antibiotic-recognition domain-containing protein [Promicromonospora thailandica]
MYWSIQEIARLTGVTSRTLRHYDAVGLLPAVRTTASGPRRYDRTAVVRLQRILLLRDLGLGLGDIATLLDSEQDEVPALRRHLVSLRAEQDRLARQIASVERTVAALEQDPDAKEDIMAQDMLDGFDHTRYEQEVTERWGRDAYEQGDRWWTGLGKEEQDAFKADVAALSKAWADAAEAGTDPASDEAQALAARHAAWLVAVPGTPGHGQGRPDKGYLLGLADLYVADDRFATSYGGTGGATFVRDALRVYAEHAYPEDAS